MNRTARPLIVGNWKMNGKAADGLALASTLAEQMREADPAPCDMAICPPSTLIGAVVGAVDGSPVAVGGQNCHTEVSGAYTGEVAAAMLADLGCRYVIVGHSERRRDFGEADEQVAAKAAAAREAGLTPIICVGETLEERDGGRAVQVVEAQLTGSVPPGAGDVVVAYEPVWAIGTGRTPSTDDVAEIHRAIRARLAAARAENAGAPILYGGSAKAANAAELLATEEVGGLLVGGASLDAEEFWAIAQAGPGA